MGFLGHMKKPEAETEDKGKLTANENFLLVLTQGYSQP